MTQRRKILDTACKLTGGDRDASYGTPITNMQDTARFWDAYLLSKGVCLVGSNGEPVTFSGEDVANMMVLLKMARMGASYKEDNYVDAAGYTAIAGECAQFERPPED